MIDCTSSKANECVIAEKCPRIATLEYRLLAFLNERNALTTLAIHFVWKTVKHVANVWKWI